MLVDLYIAISFAVILSPILIPLLYEIPRDTILYFGHRRYNREIVKHKYRLSSAENSQRLIDYRRTSLAHKLHVRFLNRLARHQRALARSWRYRNS